MIEVIQKHRKIALIVSNMALLIAAVGGISSLFGKQVEYYQRNRESMVKNIWEAAGFEAMSFEMTVSIVECIKQALDSMLVGMITTYLIGMGISFGTEKVMWGKTDTNNLIEIILLILLYISESIAKVLSNLATELFPGLMLVGILGAFYMLTKDRFSMKEQAFYMSLLIGPLDFLCFVFFSKASVLINSSCIPIRRYTDMDQTLKEEIIQLASQNGITEDNVFILREKSINACATSGLRFKYIFINVGALNAMSGDPLKAVLHHEIGHVIYHHIPKSCVIIQLYSYPLCALVIFLYRKISHYYNGCAAFVSCHYVIASLNILMVHFFNHYNKQRNEYQADYAAYSKSEVKQGLIDAFMVLAKISDGGLFDYEPYISLLTSHPSTHKRIKAAEKFN